MKSLKSDENNAGIEILPSSTVTHKLPFVPSSFVVSISVQDTPIKSLTRGVKSHARPRDNFRAMMGVRGGEGESLLRRFVRISRPRPDSDDWFYIETANG